MRTQFLKYNNCKLHVKLVYPNCTVSEINAQPVLIVVDEVSKFISCQFFGHVINLA